MESQLTQLSFQKLSHLAKQPERTNQFAAGYDLFSIQDIVIQPNKRQLIKTGIALQIPQGYYGKIYSRSGLSKKFCLDVKAGVIDEDYRGDVGIILQNNNDKEYKVEIGDKIAQIVFMKYETFYMIEQDQLQESQRQGQGFGSSGMK